MLSVEKTSGAHAIEICAFGGRRRGSRRAQLGFGSLAAALLIAITACSSSATKSPSTTLKPADKLLQQGLAAQNAGRISEAKQDYLAVIHIDPANKIAYYDLGVIYQRQNDATNAAVYYQKALLADPKYKPALFNLAVLDASTAPQTAIALYRQLLVLNANDANVHFNLGLLLRTTNQAVEGNAEIATALKLDPGLASRLPAEPATSIETTSTTARR
jgi:tetratricopeptide (TPR) repeat protein